MCACAERVCCVWCEDVACAPVQSMCAVRGVRMWSVCCAERCVWCEDVACVPA